MIIATCPLFDFIMSSKSRIMIIISSCYLSRWVPMEPWFHPAHHVDCMLLSISFTLFLLSFRILLSKHVLMEYLQLKAPEVKYQSAKYLGTLLWYSRYHIWFFLPIIKHLISQSFCAFIFWTWKIWLTKRAVTFYYIMHLQYLLSIFSLLYRVNKLL